MPPLGKHRPLLATSLTLAASLLTSLLASAQTTSPSSQPAAHPTTRPVGNLSPKDKAFVQVIQCYDNARRIGMALAVYAAENDTKYPPDLGTLAIEERLDLPHVICPASPSLLPADWQSLPDNARAKWVNDHTDYIYLAAGKKEGDIKPDQPLLYEKADDHNNKNICVVFGDYHADILPLADARKTFGPKTGTESHTTRLTPIPGKTIPHPLIALDDAKDIVCRTVLAGLKNSLNLFEIDKGRYPTTQEGLKILLQKSPSGQPYLDSVPLDPWNHPYIYKATNQPKHPYDLFSPGADGKPNTPDDVH